VDTECACVDISARK